MRIALVRVDDRLLHAQIVEGWLPAVRPAEIWVASDTAVSDPILPGLLAAASPEVPCRLFSVEEAAAEIRTSDAEKRILLLVGNLKDLERLHKAGVGLETVNLGGLHFRPGTRCLRMHLYLDEEDERILLRLAAAGVKFEARMLPSDAREDPLELLAGRK